MTEEFNPYANLARGENETMLEAALYYADSGIPVFPCGAANDPKAPRVAGGFKSATTDKAQIREWWTRWPDAPIGVPTGARSGWTAFDVDPRNGGNLTFDDLKTAYPDLDWTETRTHITGSGGVHLIFEHDPEVTRCATEVLPGIDIKDEGGYIIVPPSQPAGFGKYTEKIDADPIAQPAWLVDIRRTVASRQDSAPVERAESRGDTKPEVLGSIAALIASVWKNGSRNALNMSAAAYLYTKGFTARDVESVMERVYAETKDEDAANRRDNVRRTINRIDEHQTVKGASYLHEKHPDLLRMLDGFTDRPTSDLLFKGASAVMDEEPPEWVIDNLVMANGVTTLTAESGAGKSFTTLSMGSSVESGTKWCGRETKRGSVAYISWEGDAFGIRFKALAQRYPVSNIYLLRYEKPITPVEDQHGNENASVGEVEITHQLELLKKHIAEIGGPAVAMVVIDTYRAASRGGENDDDKVAATLRAARRMLKVVPGAAIVVIHHTGWQDGEMKRKRERGSSVFRGNVDSSLYLEVTGDDASTGTTYLRMKAMKERDAASGGYIHLARQTVVVGTDKRGRELTSCVVFPDPRTHEERQREEKARDKAKIDFAVRAILKAVAADPNITNRERMQKLARVGTEAFDEAMRIAALSELLIKVGKAYTLTAEGREYLGAVNTAAEAAKEGE